MVHNYVGVRKGLHGRGSLSIWVCEQVHGTIELYVQFYDTRVPFAWYVMLAQGFPWFMEEGNGYMLHGVLQWVLLIS